MYVNRQRLNRPSLKITRRATQDQPDDFIFEVWSPFTGLYQQVDSLESGLQRINELTRLISQMRVQRHPKQGELIDVPDSVAGDGEQWAEFRVSATTFRSYDTRGYDRLGWLPAAGLHEAAKATCGKVGCAMPNLVAA
jgi:hypothetical protein